MTFLTDASVKTVTTLSDGDLIHNVDVSDVTSNAAGTSAKITVGNLKSVLGVIFIEKTVTLDYEVLSTDNRILVDATSGNITITLPAITAAFQNKSDILIKRVDSSLNTVTIVGTGGNYEDEGLTLDNTPPFDLTRVFASNSNIWRSA